MLTCCSSYFEFFWLYCCYTRSTVYCSLKLVKWLTISIYCTRPHLTTHEWNHSRTLCRAGGVDKGIRADQPAAGGAQRWNRRSVGWPVRPVVLLHTGTPAGFESTRLQPSDRKSDAVPLGYRAIVYCSCTSVLIHSWTLTIHSHTS